METWFTEKIIDDKTIVISEYQHFEETHSYLLIGSEKSLLIDSGLGVANIKKIIEKYVDAKKVMVVATHAHWDHLGGHRYFENVFVNRHEKDWLTGKFPRTLDQIKQDFTDECFTHGKPGWFDTDKYEIYRNDRIQEITNGHVFDLGNRKIISMETPGHSPGHMCFFEKESGYLFTGDNLYRGTIYVNYPSTDPVEYKKSIDRIYELRLKIKRLLPAHHDLNIGIEVLDEMKNILDRLAQEGKLGQGHGLVQGKEISILL